MANVALVPALAKTLLAIAWSDGELHPEEETTLKEVVGLLPALSAQEWAIIELYLVAPIGVQERDELLQNVLSHIRSRADKSLALEAVDAMLRADGLVQPEEEIVAQRIRAAIADADVSPLGLVGKVIGGVTRGAPQRERGLELWRTNPVYYLLQTRMPGAALDGARPQVEVAALAAGIMAQVARLARPASSSAERVERPIIAGALAEDWQIAQALAEPLAVAALDITRRNVDYHRISRELTPRSSVVQRAALLDTLFAIANAADQVAPGEIDEIRVIAERLNLTRQQFIAAKLKIPAAERGGL